MTNRVLRVILSILFGVVIGGGLELLALILTPPFMCAAPPQGWYRVWPPVWVVFLILAAPPAVAAASAYVALGLRRGLGTWLAIGGAGLLTVATTLAMEIVVLEVGILGCGRYAP